MRVLVFGPFGGHSSYPVVMRGLSGAFEELGLEVLRADMTNVGGDLTTAEVKRLSVGKMSDGLQVDLVFAMKPSFQMTQGLYEQGVKVVGLHVGDVSQIPEDWKLAMRFEALVVTPSSWMKSVIEDSLDIHVPIFVANHGIQDEYLVDIAKERTFLGSFQFLHFCSAGVYPERKGTPEALSAFQKLAMKEGSVGLTLVVPELRRRLKRLLAQLAPGVRDRVLVSTRPRGMSPRALIKMYQEHHALLCPSRAEGFGIQPLESRALGVPVIMTLCTGFADHFKPDEVPEELGVIPVPHGDLKEAWGGFGAAPSVSGEDIYTSMQFMMKHNDALQDAARRYAPQMKKWSWVSQTRGLVAKLQEVGSR